MTEQRDGAGAGRVQAECRLALARESFHLQAEFNFSGPGVTGIFGPSGCGKTALLRCIAGLESAASGRLVVGGETWQDDARAVRLAPHRRSVGYVFQEPRLFPHLTVHGNVCYGLRRKRGADGVGFEHAVALLDLGPLLERRPSQLSGGEQRRVAIARAVLRAPRLLLLDEPLAGLDGARRNEVLPFLERLQRELALPILYVSHELEEIVRLCRDLVLMEQGRVLASGILNEVLVRLDLPLAWRDDAGAVLIATVQDYDAHYDLTRLAFQGGSVVLPGRQGDSGREIRLHVLARDVSVSLRRPQDSSILNVLEVTVAEIQRSEGALVTVRLAAGPATMLLARITSRSLERLAIRAGQRLFAQLKAVAVKHI